mgnify:CR=1 FL=1
MADKKSKEEKKQAGEEKKQQKKAAKEKKKADKAAAKKEKKAAKDQQSPPAEQGTEAAEQKKAGFLKRLTSFFSLKKMAVTLLILLAVGASAYTVYYFYFTGNDKAAAYRDTVLENVDLPDEMLEFTFHQMPKLYDALKTYNRYSAMINSEIERIKAIGEQYPDQKEIVSDQTEEWTDRKEEMDKVYNDIENQIKDLYVLFHVNREKGENRITDTKEELYADAEESLSEMEPYADKLSTRHEKKPGGLFSGITRKIKNLFK